MKLKVFHASDGDCLLLSSDGGGKNLLIDGGRKESFKANTRPHLKKLSQENKKLDVVCVSHIDNDHIAGIVQLVEDELKWRIHEFNLKDNPNAKPPKIPRPPVVGEIWHNALFQLVGDNLAPQIESILATTAGLLAGSKDEKAQDLASHYDNLATGEGAAMELSRRISDEQLAIPLNPPANGDLIMRGNPGETISLGDIQLFVLGPSKDDLEKLQTEWQTWLALNKQGIHDLHQRMLADEDQLGTLKPKLVANPIKEDLGQGLSSITKPNLASLMLLAEQDSQSILLTGDGESGAILQGLAHHGKLDAEKRIHVTVLKVQHHGALANVTEKFVDSVTADHYIFCGNGAHKNPEKKVVEAFAEARLASTDSDFKFWFTSNSNTPELTPDRRKHMVTIENLVNDLVNGSGGRMEAEFLSKGSFDIL